MNQRDKAEAFRAMHTSGDILVLPNAWDAISAKVLEAAGFPAVATASASVSWANGVKDGEGLSLDQALAAIRLIASSVGVPVTADIEKGFGATPDDVGRTVTMVLDAGAIGINIEDSTGEGQDQCDIADMQARIRAAKAAGEAAGVPLVINARVDAYLLGKSGDDIYADTIARGKAWREAGADCVFVPGPKDADLIGRLVRDIGGPINVIVIDETTLGTGALQDLGVARVSTGPRLMQAAMGALHDAARVMREEKDFSFLTGAPGFAELNNLF